MIIEANIASPLGKTAPAEFVYIPEGTSEIRPMVNGKPADQGVRVSVPAHRGPEIAARLQSDLADRQRQNVRPWVDFQHENGRSAGNPTGFRYEPGRGVILGMDWSSAGRSAVEGKDFGYFSPRFDLGDDGEPAGLPKRGPVGGLVNEPAFRGIPAIAAKDTGGSEPGGNVFIEAARMRDEARGRLESRARRLVAAGDAASEGEGLELACAENPDDYDVAFTTGAALARIEGARKEAEDERADVHEGGDPEAQLRDAAKKLVAAGDAADMQDGIAMAVEADPGLYDAYTSRIIS